MTDDRPEPLVSAEVDLRDFPFTPMYRARLFGSAFNAKVNDSEWRSGVTLWLKSQDQVPAGSLPNDDIELCRLAELGRDLRTWRKVRVNALHGWFECSDGRLYNRVTAQIANEQWQSKIDQRNRTVKARIAALEKRLSQNPDASVTADIEGQLQVLRQSLTRPVTEIVTASKGQGSEEKGQLRDSTPLTPQGGKPSEVPKNGPGRKNRITNAQLGAADTLRELAKYRDSTEGMGAPNGFGAGDAGADRGNAAGPGNHLPGPELGQTTGGEEISLVLRRSGTPDGTAIAPSLRAVSEKS